MQTIRRVVPLLALLALLAAPSLFAQTAAPLRRAEIQAAAAPDAYALLDSLRHGWLWAAGDPSTPAAQTRTLVYIDGRYAGDLRLLRGLSTAELVAVRHMDRAEFLRTDVYAPHTDIASVFFLTSRRAARAALPDGSRVMVTLGAAVGQPVSSGLRDHLTETGYDRPIPSSTGDRHNPFDEAGIVPEMVGAVRYLLRPGLSVEGGLQGGSTARAGGYDGVRGSVVNRSTATEAFAMVQVGRETLRLGVGPTLRRTVWAWGRTSCGCAEVQRTVSLHPGLAADAAFTLPARERGFLELRVQSRFYGTTHTPEYRYRNGGATDFVVPSMERAPFYIAGAVLVGVRL